MRLLLRLLRILHLLFFFVLHRRLLFFGGGGGRGATSSIRRVQDTQPNLHTING